jgi:hypothetical protein
MNRAAVAGGAKLRFLFLWLFANGPVLLLNFIKILIHSMHLVQFQVVLFAVWIAGSDAVTLIRVLFVRK